MLILILFSVFQCLGGTAFISAAQSGFVNKIIRTLYKIVPDIDPSVVVATGATQLRHAFPADQIQKIIAAYMAGLRAAFALAIAGTVVGLVVSVFSKWKRLDIGSARAVETAI